MPRQGRRLQADMPLQRAAHLGQGGLHVRLHRRTPERRILVRMNTQASVSRPPPGGNRGSSVKRRSPFLEQVRGVLRVKRYAYTTEKTTEIYTHVLKRGPRGVTSPVDRIRLPAAKAFSCDSPTVAGPDGAGRIHVPRPSLALPRPTCAATADPGNTSLSVRPKTPPVPDPVAHARLRLAWRWLRGIAAGLILALTPRSG